MFGPLEDVIAALTRAETARLGDFIRYVAEHEAELAPLSFPIGFRVALGGFALEATKPGDRHE